MIVTFILTLLLFATMKKLFITLLALVYLAPVIGYTVSVTSCGMKKGLFAICACTIPKENSCCKSKKKADNACCKNKQVIIKLSDSHHKATLSSPNFDTVATLPATTVSPIAQATLLPALEKPVVFFPRPPDCYPQDIYLLHRVFLI